jgi:hypothetical protein
MDLLLRGFETPEERKATLTFLRKALSTERPREFMLLVVDEQLAELDRASALEQEIAASAEREQELGLELRESVLEVTQLRAQLNATESSSRSDAIKRKELEAKLDQSERRRVAREQELEAERERTRDLVQSLNDAKVAAGTRAPPEPTATGDAALSQYFEESKTPLAEQELLRSLQTLCESYGGRGLLVYSGPGAPGITCIIDDERLTLDRRSLLVRRSPYSDRFMGGPPRTGNPYLDGEMACSSIGGKLVSLSVAGVTALCRLDNGRGVIVDTY